MEIKSNTITTQNVNQVLQDKKQETESNITLFVRLKKLQVKEKIAFTRGMKTRLLSQAEELSEEVDNRIKRIALNKFSTFKKTRIKMLSKTKFPLDELKERLENAKDNRLDRFRVGLKTLFISKKYANMSADEILDKMSILSNAKKEEKLKSDSNIDNLLPDAAFNNLSRHLMTSKKDNETSKKRLLTDATPKEKVVGKNLLNLKSGNTSKSLSKTLVTNMIKGRKRELKLGEGTDSLETNPSRIEIKNEEYTLKYLKSISKSLARISKDLIDEQDTSFSKNNGNCFDMKKLEDMLDDFKDSMKDMLKKMLEDMLDGLNDGGGDDDDTNWWDRLPPGWWSSSDKKAKPCAKLKGAAKKRCLARHKRNKKIAKTKRNLKNHRARAKRIARVRRSIKKGWNKTKTFSRDSLKNPFTNSKVIDLLKKGNWRTIGRTVAIGVVGKGAYDSYNLSSADKNTIEAQRNALIDERSKAISERQSILNERKDLELKKETILAEQAKRTSTDQKAFYDEKIKLLNAEIASKNEAYTKLSNNINKIETNATVLASEHNKKVDRDIKIVEDLLGKTSDKNEKKVLTGVLSELKASKTGDFEAKMPVSNAEPVNGSQQAVKRVESTDPGSSKKLSTDNTKIDLKNKTTNTINPANLIKEGDTINEKNKKIAGNKDAYDKLGANSKNKTVGAVTKGGVGILLGGAIYSLAAIKEGKTLSKKANEDLKNLQLSIDKNGAWDTARIFIYGNDGYQRISQEYINANGDSLFNALQMGSYMLATTADGTVDLVKLLASASVALSKSAYNGSFDNFSGDMDSVYNSINDVTGDQPFTDVLSHVLDLYGPKKKMTEEERRNNASSYYNSMNFISGPTDEQIANAEKIKSEAMKNAPKDAVKLDSKRTEVKKLSVFGKLSSTTTTKDDPTIYNLKQSDNDLNDFLSLEVKRNQVESVDAQTGRIHFYEESKNAKYNELYDARQRAYTLFLQEGSDMAKKTKEVAGDDAGRAFDVYQLNNRAPRKNEVDYNNLTDRRVESHPYMISVKNYGEAQATPKGFIDIDSFTKVIIKEIKIAQALLASSMSKEQRGSITVTNITEAYKDMTTVLNTKTSGNKTVRDIFTQ